MVALNPGPMPSAGSHTARVSSGPTELLWTPDIPSRPMPMLERCALLSTDDTNPGRGLWEKLLYTKSPFSECKVSKLAAAWTRD